MERLYIYCFPEHIWSKIANPEKYKVTYPFVGSGPFLIDEWKHGSYIRMVKNPDYWGAAPTVDEILYEFYTNADTMTQDLKTGTIDAAYGVPPAQYDQVAKLDGFRASGQPVHVGLRVLQLLRPAQLARPPRPQGREVPAGAQLGRRQGAPGRDRLERLRAPGHHDHAARGVAGRLGRPLPARPPRSLRLRHREGQPVARRGRVHRFERRRNPRVQGQGHQLRLMSRTQSAESQSEGKLIAGWFKQCGLDITYSVIEDGAPLRPSLQLRQVGRRMRPTRHLPLELCRLRRPG